MDKKTKIASFFAVIVIVIFCWSVVNVFNANAKKQIALLEQNIKDSKTQAEEAKLSRDSAKVEAKIFSNRIFKLEGELKVTNRILGQFQNSYNNSLIELNKYKNEKDFVPDNATTAEQSDFLSKYRYKEY